MHHCMAVVLVFGYLLMRPCSLPALQIMIQNYDLLRPSFHSGRSENLMSLHGAVASLSRGPVSPADKIGLFNRTLIMRACMDDGTLLTPDRRVHICHLNLPRSTLPHICSLPLALCLIFLPLVKCARFFRTSLRDCAHAVSLCADSVHHTMRDADRP